MNEHISHVTDASFDADVLKSATPVLVDYWAEWCGPCKMIGPILEEVAKEYAGKLKVAKMDVDANQAVRTLAKAIDGTNVDAIGVLALDARLGNDISHGRSGKRRECAKF